MDRKRLKTPLEDALGRDDGGRMAKLEQWARQQFHRYYGDLATWRENRRRYAQEAQDVFAHRAGGGALDGTGGAEAGVSVAE